MNAPILLDFASVAAMALAQAESLLWTWLPAGKKRGSEFMVGNLAGDPGKSLSINLDTGLWADFAAGPEVKGKDLVSLYAAIHRLSPGDALRRVSAELGLPSHRRKSAEVILMPPRSPTPDVAWSLVMPVPAQAPSPPVFHSANGKPSHVAEYRDAANCLLYLVYRWEATPERRKTFSGVTWWQHQNGHGEWRFKSPVAPRPLFGLPALAAHPRAPVLIVEGERKAEVAQAVLQGAYAVVSWPNGAQAAEKADWSPVAGREAVMWPDADDAGREAAQHVSAQAKAVGFTLRVVEPPSGVPDKWDIHDAIKEGWDGVRVQAHLSEQAPVPAYEDYEPESREAMAADFLPMGHDRGRFYFYSRAGGQVRDFGARDLQTVGALVELAPLVHWEREYPGKTGPNVREAGAALVSACHQAGIYDGDRLRGRGAWLDGQNSVLHLGDRLLVNGHDADLDALGGYAIYERARRLTVEYDAVPLPSAAASRLMNLCMALPFEDPASMGRLLAGWCVIAPVCGAMPWRPHLWLTSEAGAGKSWVWDNILRPLLGPVAMRVQSKTTEAYLRQRLGSDALPVLFDEFESQNERDRERIQQVLDLARQASSEDGAEIGKGGQDGRARSYRIRSCFAFASINLGLTQAADESRTVVLTLRPSSDPETRQKEFDKVKLLHAEVMQAGFGAALLARTLKLLPTIRANAETFAQAIARTAGRRTGDTVGVLLAGAWSLRSPKLATTADAAEFVAEQKWVRDAVGRAAAEPEWRRALSFLAQQTLRVVRSNGKAEDIPVGELLDCLAGLRPPPKGYTVAKPDAELALTRSGIRYEETSDGAVVCIASGAEQIKRWFAASPWAGGWAATVARAPEVTKLEKAKRFGPLVSKGLCVPLTVMLGTEDA